MSYDLFLKSDKITRDSFEKYFLSKPFYEIDKDQACYTNEDTGVYFSFEINDGEDDDSEFSYQAAFNINYFRPHVFALEAEPELKAFIDHFGCDIDDPQNKGMNDGIYSAEGFIRGWNNGNEFSYRSILNMQDADVNPQTKPAEELEKIWSWNKNRRVLDEKLTEDIFIPKIMFGVIDGQFGTFSVWPDAIPTLIPKTDFLYIPRSELAPKAGWFKKKEDDFAFISFSKALPLIAQFSVADFDLSAYKLPVNNLPKTIVGFVKGLEKFEGQIEGIGADQVLNSELVDKYKP